MSTVSGVNEVPDSYYEDDTRSTLTIDGKSYTDTTSLHTGKYVVGVMIQRVMSLLAIMIETMQSVAVTQSDKLNFFTKMQQATTEQMNTIHTFQANNSDAFVSEDSTEMNTKRQDMNTDSTNAVQSLQAYVNTLSNKAKTIQTQINQTQEAVSQQSNMLTSLIQQARSIASAITRG